MLHKIKSPIFYNGNKYTLLNKIMPHIPSNKDGTFYDIFGGSGTMSLNNASRFKKVVYNELQDHVYRMFKWAMNEADKEHIRNRMISLNEKYNFMFELTHDQRNKLVASRLANKHENYYGWRKFIKEEDISKISEAELLYIASCFSFSNTLKFTTDGKLGKSCGVYNFTNSYVDKFDVLKTIKNIEFWNKSFLDIDIDIFKEGDFIYIDPPYWGTEANYNKIWTWELETKLLEFLETLIKKGIKFAMSNVFSNKGHKNTHLEDFCRKHDLTVHHFHKIYNTNASSGIADEVLICNYKSHVSEQISFKLF